MKYLVQLTKGEKHCLSVIEEFGIKVCNMSINEISNLSHYSTATINRLLKKMGYSSWKSYKVKVFNKYSRVVEINQVAIIKEMYDQELTYEFNVLITKLSSAKMIHIIGKGISKGCVNELGIALDLRGYNVIIHESCEMLVSNAIRIIKEDDIVIMASHSGRDFEMIEIANALKHHSYVVVLTVTKHNYLSKNADLVIKSCGEHFTENIKLNLPLSIIVHRLLIELDKKLLH